jgi:predicted hydrolase (HD superfamily)
VPPDGTPRHGRENPSDEGTGAVLTREEAWVHLCSWTSTPSLRRHARAVEIVMRHAAHVYGGGTPSEVEAWGVAGMLHDADYEQWPSEHPRRIVAWLRERGEEDLAHAVSAHFTQWNVPHRTPMDRALVACDELTGFIMACCLVRPEGVNGLAPASVMKKLATKTFAAKVDRHEITAGAALLGVELPAHIGFVIEALAPHAEELGLGPR